MLNYFAKSYEDHVTCDGIFDSCALISSYIIFVNIRAIIQITRFANMNILISTGYYRRGQKEMSGQEEKKKLKWRFKFSFSQSKLL